MQKGKESQNTNVHKNLYSQPIKSNLKIFKYGCKWKFQQEAFFYCLQENETTMPLIQDPKFKARSKKAEIASCSYSTMLGDGSCHRFRMGLAN